MAADLTTATEKLCKDCGLTKPASAFSKDKSKKTGLATYCKDCQAKRMAKYYPANADKMRKRAKDWYYQNTERSKSAAADWTKRNRERYLKRRNGRHKERMQSDYNYRLDYVMRATLRRIIKKGGRSGKLPYTSDQLRQRIQCQFVKGMDWSNYGDWEIDHKIPMSVMLKRGEVRPHVINALSNLQPMWKKQNRSKGARYVG
mgnify:CR=1 FL=1